jgi:hypothetical protein
VLIPIPVAVIHPLRQFYFHYSVHTWGYRNYATGDDSRNNWWIALLTGGEGWHNNHHTTITTTHAPGTTGGAGGRSTLARCSSHASGPATAQRWPARRRPRWPRRGRAASLDGHHLMIGTVSRSVL